MTDADLKYQKAHKRLAAARLRIIAAEAELVATYSFEIGDVSLEAYLKQLTASVRRRADSLDAEAR